MKFVRINEGLCVNPESVTKIRCYQVARSDDESWKVVIHFFDEDYVELVENVDRAGAEAVYERVIELINGGDLQC